jgi:hypothetical protein
MRDMRSPAVCSRLATDLEAELADLRAVGDEIQSAASRMATHLLIDPEASPPYEVEMAAREARSAVDRWTELRKGVAA